MKILIILYGSYPIGMASTKRIHLYAKGLAKLGNNVKIVIPKPYEEKVSINNDNTKGTIDGVEFEYASKSTIRSDYFMGRRKQDFFAFFKTLILSYSFKPNIVLFVGNPIISIWSLKLICFFINAKFVREKSEVPYFWKEKLNLFEKLKIKLSFSLFDGIIVISNNLESFLKLDFLIESKYIRIPIIGDNKKYVNIKDYTISNNLVYTGSLVDHKDGVLTIIKSFSKITKNHNSIRLLLTGDLKKSPDRNAIIKLIKYELLEDKVIFTGFIPDKELLKITKSAKVLLLAKPDNRQNRYNAATKIGEYLLTGRPVLITNNDATCEYLKNRESVFISESNVKSFTNELEYIINNPEFADKVGSKGRLIARENFSFMIQIDRLNIFLNNI